ncbi:MAG: 4-hydroxy-tetrahydrodipicolinate reductase, partial [Silicimonas sp.]|nr:4-hydroxy-tetrahydrodipicolinate reductase [Silicimonas sp.]
MDSTPGIVIAGALGRMGQMLTAEIVASDAARLVGALEKPGHGWIGKDVGEAAGGKPIGVTVTDDPLEAMANAQALIDFTSPAATVAHAATCAQARAVHVIGTTGLSDDDIAKLDAAARHAAIIRAGNMSLGVNLLVQMTRKIAAALDEDF